jgi:hypothetical protein
MSRAGLVPVAEAARRLGLTYRRPDLWLRRELQRRERDMRVQILVRIGEGTKRPTYAVNMSRLRAYCPDLLAPGDGFANALTGEVKRMSRKLDGIGDQVDDLTHDVETLAAAVRKLQAVFISDGR